MRMVVDQFRVNSSVQELAVRIVRSAREKNAASEAAALLRFVQRRIRYVRDPVSNETVRSPVRTLELGAGDCDDKSVLFGALAEAIGWHVRFVAVGPLPGTYCHVYPEVRVGENWVPAECIENWPLGRAPAGMASRMVIDGRGIISE